MMGIPAEEWDDPPSPGLMFCHTSSQKFLDMEPITDEIKEAFSNNKRNINVICVVDAILDAAAESSMYDNWCLIGNQSTCNTFINGKYLPNIRDAPGGKYTHVHCNSVVTHTKNIINIPRYSNPAWYSPKGVSNILSHGLVQKHHLGTYNIQYGNEFFVRIP